jgi:molybdopterin-guanine dinucleotide biosynthesis protein A
METKAANRDHILGVILAGGQGRRMGGRDKAVVLLAGRPLAAHVARRLAPQLPPGRLVLNANGPPEALAELGLPVVGDATANRPGPLAGLVTAMQAAKAMSPAADWVLSVPTDTPFLPDDLLDRLAAEAAAGEAEIVLAASAGGLCQVCGLWSVGLQDSLAAALASGQNKVLDFVERHRWARVEFPPQSIGAATCDPFFNVNTPEDLARATELLDSQQA